MGGPIREGGQNGQGFLHKVSLMGAEEGFGVESGSSHFRITCHFNAVSGPQN